MENKKYSEIMLKKLDDNRLSQNKYIISFSIVTTLFVINIAVYLLSFHMAIYGFFILGIAEFILVKFRFNDIEKYPNMDILSTLFLLLPSMMVLLFNNKSEGFPIGVTGLIFLLGFRIYLMTAKTKKRDERRNSSKVLFTLVALILFLSNFYFIIFYNYQNKVKWVAKIPSGITSNLKFSGGNVLLLTNDDFLMRNFYDFPQTYTVDENSGKVINVEAGYKFSEEFKPFKGKVEKIEYENLEISVRGTKLYIKDIYSKKQLFKFIVNGDIVITPTIKDNILYFATNGRVAMDKVKRTNVYAVDIAFRVKK